MMVSAERWGVMSPSLPLWLLAALELANGITFGISYLELMNFIANWTPGHVTAEALCFATVMRLAGVVVILSGFGHVIDALGIQAFAVGIVIPLAAAGLVVSSLRTVPRADSGL